MINIICKIKIFYFNQNELLKYVHNEFVTKIINLKALISSPSTASYPQLLTITWNRLPCFELFQFLFNFIKCLDTGLGTENNDITQYFQSIRGEL